MSWGTFSGFPGSGAVALALAIVVMLPRASSAAPPEPVDETFVIEGVCDFPVLADMTGKVKFIDLPGARYHNRAGSSRYSNHP